MSLCDKRAQFQVIGCLLKKPTLLLEVEKYNLANDDFPEPFHKIIFASIVNLYKQGVVSIDYIAIDNFLSNYDKQYAIFNDNNGMEYLQSAYENSELKNFEYNYNRLKKFSLLRKYEENGIDISYIYDESVVSPKEQEEMQERFEDMSLNDIIDEVDKKVLAIKQNYTIGYGNYGQQAGKGMKQLKEELKQTPEMGAPLQSKILNKIARGARLTKIYMRSAPTGIGKTRLSIGDVCCLAVNEYYDTEKHKWIKTSAQGEPSLFITTELKIDEVQTPMMAYVSGVNEDSILDGMYQGNEEDRVDHAIDLIENAPLYIEHMPNFDINDIERKIQEYILEYKVKYIFFDYIHTSLKLLEEIAKQSRGMKLREDNVLLMFVDRLKSMCNKYGVFLYTSTQVTGEWKVVKDADQNILRGAKAMADKLDLGIIALEPTKSDLESLKPILQQGFYPVPNLVYHIYKNRRGKFVRVKLWLYTDLGTCRTTDLFVTNRDYQLIPIEAVDIKMFDDLEEEELEDFEAEIEENIEETSKYDF